MPGMMDTVLNLGLNDETCAAVIKLAGNERFAYDAYRRFVMMFSDIVLSGDYPELKKDKFEHIFDALKEKVGAKQDTDVDAAGLKELVGQFKDYYRKVVGEEFPTDPMNSWSWPSRPSFKSGTTSAPSSTATARDLPRPRHRREHPDHGVRQYGR